jgi:hypothetical protein
MAAPQWLQRIFSGAGLGIANGSRQRGQEMVIAMKMPRGCDAICETEFVVGRLPFDESIYQSMFRFGKG